jgi:hypothetical protein
MAKVKKMAFGGLSLSKLSQMRSPAFGARPGGLTAIKSPLAQQQAQYDKNMAQAAALPAAQRAQFAQQFQQAAERKDPSTIRPGTIMGKPGGLTAANAASAAGLQQMAQRAAAQTKPTGLGSAMSGPKTGLGTAMGMNKLAGAGVALGKKLGMKSGGSVGSASKRADGIATKGKTKGKMI